MKKLLPIGALLLMACAPPHSDVKAIVGAKMGEWEHSVVLIERGKITVTGSQQDVPVPKGAEITGGVGAEIDPTVKPGDAATFTLKGAANRAMKDGNWVN